MLLQEKQLSNLPLTTVNFPDSLAGQSLIALLNVIVHFSERQGKDRKNILNFQAFEEKNSKIVLFE